VAVVAGRIIVASNCCHSFRFQGLVLNLSIERLENLKGRHLVCPLLLRLIQAD
jgi:hypothetical protein